MEEQTQQRTTSSVRLRFVLGQRTAELALPAEVPIADLLPAILLQFGAETIEEGAEHEGWVLQRLGEQPLDEDRSPGQLNLLDGESVYLAPRADQLAAIDYDDLVDGVGDRVREHPGKLTPVGVRRMLETGALVVLLSGLYLLPGSGAPAVQAQLVGGCAIVLLLVAALVARGAGSSRAAVTLAGGGVGYAILSAWLIVDVLAPKAPLMVQITAAGAGGLIALTVGLMAVADAALLFAGGIILSLTVAIAGLVGSIAPVSTAQAAGVGLAVSLVMGVFVGPMAFRLSGLSLPMLPTGADELSDDIDPVPFETVVDRGAAVVGYSTALHVGLGLAQVLLILLLVSEADTWSMVLALVAAVLLALRSRHPSGTVARWSMLVPAAAALWTVVAHFAAELSPAGRLLLVVPLVLLGSGLLLVAAERLPGARLRPYWGRSAEIFETITAIAILPILLQVLHVYATVRNMVS
ncbi:type VII secretion integral membrane protein EccD [Amycolatopsis sp. WAC 04197]|uniref:type VII secretion integral membrane protein EccD n=1 Tax=Amycolatopsis sp. WAC 04197 TaxID=2203199 RepID=UPI000F774E2B|nr:type VII secretion integral membrane protein EccD [Amycolatopsis sp. WAC 04197]RSN39932.1 type VII secretion integral membrane protein EccD [Amycolatopsis sp. WAC 04197]